MVSLLLLRLIVLKKEVSRKHIYCIAKSWGFLRAGVPQKKSGCIQYTATHLPFLGQALLKIHLLSPSIDTNVSTLKKLSTLLLMSTSNFNYF